MMLSSCFAVEVHPSESLFDKLARFNGFLGMPVVGFENEILSLLRKMDARRGHGGKVRGGGAMGGGWKRKPKALSCFNREIQKLECLVNYNRSPMFARGKERSNGDQAIVQ